MNRFFNILILFTLSLFVFSAQNSFAQELNGRKVKKFVKKGRKAYRKEEYWKAKSYYDKVTDANPSKAQYWFEAGLAYYDSQVQREDAIVYFEKALNLSVEDTIPEILYYAGKTYHFNGEFEKAIEFYNMFLNRISENKTGQATKQDVIREIEICNNGIDLRNVHLYAVEEIVKLDDSVNSEYLDYSPVLTDDQNLILFCSRRPPGRKKHVDGLYYEDIFYTNRINDKWQEAAVIDKSSGYISREINDGKEHVAPVSLSPDGQTLYIYKRNSIWKSKQDGEGKWSVPIRMNQNVNIGEANPSIFITPDETEMFIVSTGVKDGFGERDIYYSSKNEDGNWKKPVNMGPKINTKYKEDAPYLSKDGKSLYFASQGHNSMGGFDIFRSVRDENGEWGEPKNIGTPVNSAGDDIYYVENDEGTLAYYSSMRPGSYGYLDIYTAKYGCKNIKTTEVKGYAIYSENHLPVNGIIKITNLKSGEEMGTFPIDQATGKYQMVLPPNATYEMELIVAQEGSYEQERPHKEEFFIPKQCEVYNLFQQINIQQTKDEDGNLVSQSASFSHAMFDVESKLEQKFGIDDFEYKENQNTFIGGISGNLAHDSESDGKSIEIVLLNEEDQIVRVTRSDEKGDFIFEKLDTSVSYKVMVNEDDALISYNEGPNSHPSQFYLQGVLYDFVERDNIPRPETTIFLAKTDKILTDMSVTDLVGEFEFKNPTTPLSVIEELNDNTTITYNLDQSDSEILYSALLTTLDPDDENYTHTESVDIVDLKKMTETDSSLQEFANILFDFDKFFLRQKSEDVLENLYQFLVQNPSVEVKLDGHTDWFGTDEYNEALSKKRALSAHKYLIDKGIAASRIENAWFGESKPSVPNANSDGSDNEANRQLNRRVEIKVEVPELADLYLSL